MSDGAANGGEAAVCLFDIAGTESGAGVGRVGAFFSTTKIVSRPFALTLHVHQPSHLEDAHTRTLRFSRDLAPDILAAGYVLGLFVSVHCTLLTSAPRHPYNGLWKLSPTRTHPPSMVLALYAIELPTIFAVALKQL